MMYHSALDASNGPWPTNVEIVKGYYREIVDWFVISPCP